MFCDVVPNLLRAGRKSIDSFHVSHRRATSSYCLDQVLELKDVISDCQPCFTRNITNMHYKYFNIIIQPLKFWHLFGKGCLQRDIFSKLYIDSFRSLSFFFVENIFAIREVPRIKGYKNDKMLKPQLDSSSLRFVGSWVYTQ